MKLEAWSVVSKMSLVSSPDLPRRHLMGKIFDHPEFIPGATITTAEIIDFDGRICTTQSGMTIELGNINPNYGKQYPQTRDVLMRNYNTHHQPKEKHAC